MQKYIFIGGILQPQRIKKYELAWFYGVSPRQFRRELELFCFSKPKSRYYTAKETEIIFKHLGELTTADVEGAKENIADYLFSERQYRKLKKFK